MKIHVYAGLKDYFQPEFEVESVVRNTDELKALLVTINGKAEPILSFCPVCRRRKDSSTTNITYLAMTPSSSSLPVVGDRGEAGMDPATGR